MHCAGGPAIKGKFLKIDDNGAMINFVGNASSMRRLQHIKEVNSNTRSAVPQEMSCHRAHSSSSPWRRFITTSIGTPSGSTRQSSSISNASIAPKDLSEQRARHVFVIGSVVSCVVNAGSLHCVVGTGQPFTVQRTSVLWRSIQLV